MSGFRELGTKLRNWRRWGPDDELGTVDFITPASRKRGAEAVRSGTTAWRRPAPSGGPVTSSSPGRA